jgi:hypothetical protein
MASKPIARFLVELDPKKPAPAQQKAPPAAPRTAQSAAPAAPAKSLFPAVRREADRPAGAPEASPFPSVDHTKARIDEAFERGAADAKARAWAEFSIMLADENRKFQETLACERAAWVAAQAELFERQLTPALADIEARIAQAAVRVLGPVLLAATREQAAEALAGKLHVLLAKDGAARLVISGPEDLLQALREKLGSHAIAAAFLPGAASGIRAEIGQTTIETCIAEWAGALGLPAASPSPPPEQETAE